MALPQIDVSYRKFFLFAVFVTCMRCAAGDEPSSQAQSNLYSRLVYCEIVQNQEKGHLQPELVLHKLPYLDDQGVVQTKDRRSLIANRSEVLGVAGGRLILAGPIGAVETVRFETGLHQELIRYRSAMIVDPTHDELILTTPDECRLQKYGIDGKQLGDIPLKKPDPGLWATTHQRVAVSKSGQVAVATLHHAEPAEVNNMQFDLQLADFAGRQVVLIPLEQPLPAILVMTGGGTHFAAPPFIWLDENTLLALISKRPDPAPVQGGRGFLVLDGLSYELISIDAMTGAVTKICEHPPLQNPFGMTLFEHEFWRRSDGELMLRSQSAGDFRVDLKQKKIVPDGHLSKYYQLKGDMKSPSLWFGDQMLAEMVFLRDVSISPDGRQIVWLTHDLRRPQEFANANARKTMHYHSLTTGEHELHAGMFRSLRGWDRADNPNSDPAVYWISESDFELEQAAE